MAGTAVRGRLTWEVATVTSVADETPSVRTIDLELPGWAGHRAGQHLDVRLTSEDGYRAERSYSIASAPGEQLAITVERLANGEVSPYLTEELRPGDEVEIRGPIGGYFVWDGDASIPLLLVAGGSGIVPFRSILRERSRLDSSVEIRLLFSARSYPDLIYRTELDQLHGGVELVYTLTRQQPPGWTGRTGRVDEAMLGDVAWPVTLEPLAFVCGPTPFVETVAEGLVRFGYPPARVKTERFGGTGGS
jgi:ferredoxin-NADP reductase